MVFFSVLSFFKGLKMVRKKKKFIERIYTIIILLLSICTFFSVNTFSAYAEEIIYYSDVLEDLRKDENFKIEDYPVIEDDYSLQVIQIAESVNNELFIYVYQPSASLLATSLNMTIDYHASSNYLNYKLRYLNIPLFYDKIIVNY